MKKKTPIVKKRHPEAKGLFTLFSSLLLFASLISFEYQNPQSCFLGSIGYWASFGLLHIFGLGSYLITGFLGWVGIKALLQKKSIFPYPLYFSLFLFSLCMNLTVLADYFGHLFSFLDQKILSETFVSYSPEAKIVFRKNLGGVFFYYLYQDLPLINSKTLISGLGTFLFFTFTGVIFFFLMTGLRMTEILKGFFSLIKKTTLFLLFTLKKTLIMSFSLGKKAFSSKVFIKRIFNKLFSKKKSNDIFPSKPDIYTSDQLSFSDLEKKMEENATLSKKEPSEKKPSEKILTKSSAQTNISSSSESLGRIYELPSFNHLADPKKIHTPTLKKELERQAEILEQTLKSFNIEAKVGKINCGPTITSFEVLPSIGVKVQKIKALQNDIALNLQAKSIRIIAPIPGKKAVGVEIPSLFPQEVRFKELLYEYNQMKKKPSIPVFLGKTVSGESVITDLAKMPHCLIAGATGSGKSVCINSMVMSILMTSTPEQVRMVMIDPKKVELTQYSTLPHMIAPVVTEPHGAYAALQWLVKEMQNRYEILKQLGLRNISAFNKRKVDRAMEESLNIEIPEKMYMIVAIVDEFADLMMVSSSDLETPIARIAQMARAVGIHLVLATQRPSREVITGIIKANFPCRIAFKVSSRINSQIILDDIGAENLLGNGDLLFLPPGSAQLIRAQGAYISDEDINVTLDKITRKTPTNYLIPSFDAMLKLEDSLDGNKPKDALYEQALDIVLDTRTASTTFLQRKLKVGYARAASLVDELEENGIIGPQQGGKPRQILVADHED